MKPPRSAILASTLTAFVFMAGCKNSSQIATRTSDSVQPVPSLPAAATQPTPAPEPQALSESDPFTGLRVGESLGEIVAALNQRGFPDMPCTGYEGIDYEDCASHKGSPTSTEFEAIALHLHPEHNGTLYGVEYLFSEERYGDMLSYLKEQYGTPTGSNGTLAWTLGGQTLLLQRFGNNYMGPDGEAYEAFRLSKVALINKEVMADRIVESMVVKAKQDASQ